jgi:hypothetical protein
MAVSAPSYGAFAVRTPDGTVVGYVHHDRVSAKRYRAVSRTAPDVPLRRVAYVSHTEAATAIVAHHYAHARAA